MKKRALDQHTHLVGTQEAKKGPRKGLIPAQKVAQKPKGKKKRIVWSRGGGGGKKKKKAPNRKKNRSGKKKKSTHQGAKRGGLRGVSSTNLLKKRDIGKPLFHRGETKTKC